MRTHVRSATTVAGLFLATAMIGGGVAVAMPAPATTSTAAQPAAMPVAGTGHATAHSTTVNAAVNAAKAKQEIQPSAGSDTPLGIDGKPAGSALPVANAGASAVRPGSSNIGRSTTTNTATIRQAGDPAGVNQGSSGCVNCTTPDPSAAVSTNEIAETVNLTLRVTDKSGNSKCNVSLPTLLGATTGLAGPRIQYDNTANRFSIVIDSVPASSGDVPIQYLATSQTSDACGAWWIYSIIFSGTDYPLGSLIDFPSLGQDSTSILSSTNNFASGGSFIASSAYAMPKSIAYTGAPFTFNTFSVAFSTAPVTVAGNPIPSTTNTYWVAAVPGTGYDLYVMPTNPAGTISLQATISDPFNAPSRQVRQPGTSATLNPLDGRIQSSAVRNGNVVWFTHDVDDAGFPTVRYGGIDVTTNRAFTTFAFDDSGTDDFNPSIGASPAGGNTANVWVNWAYTNVSLGIPVSDTVAGTQTGENVPELAGQDLTLVTGGNRTASTTFGRYSSVSIDPSATAGCPAGLTALTTQEFFSGGQWTTDLDETTFC